MRSQLTDLELCVLGVIWRDGPMTAYEIAALFSKSLSPYWSGSAGAIYPAVKRLRSRGLAAAKRRAWNGRTKTILSATPKGVDALREWLTPPLTPEAAAPSSDPIRTRLYFLDVLPKRARIAMIDEAIRATQQQIDRIEQRRAEDERAGNVSEVIGGMGVIFEYEGRLRWLHALRAYVKDGRLPR